MFAKFFNETISLLIKEEKLFIVLKIGVVILMTASILIGIIIIFIINYDVKLVVITALML
ncbi:hypothetical protein GCM10007963_02490 [Lutibacter litoralis]|nr:hypothetical protein GCM10007963_02490 [Lutibacter litoralis]